MELTVKVTMVTIFFPILRGELFEKKIMSGRNDEILSLIDTFCDAGRDLAKALVANWLVSRDDQAETSTRIVTETAPAPSVKAVLTLSELAALLGRSTKTITKWADDFGLPELRADSEKAEPLYYWPEVLEWMHRHQKNTHPTRAGNGKLATQAPRIGTRPETRRS